jgi:hypothetical protein
MDTVVPSICLSSVAGAIFFYAGGRLGAPRSAGDLEPLPSRAELEAERAARGLAESAAAGAIRAHREEAAALADERGRVALLHDELGAERDARRRADAEAASERWRLNEEAARQRMRAEAAEARVVELGAELIRARAEVTQARAELAKAQREQELGVAAARRLAAEAAALRAKAADHARVLADLTAARAQKAEAVARAAEVEGLREENCRLAGAIAALEQERAAAHAFAGAQGRGAQEARAARDPMPEPDGTRELDTDLGLGLRELVKREEGCRAAVLSDVRGLLVAAYGAGGHRLEMAAAAALIATAGEKLRELIPLGEPWSLALVDESALVFRTRWLRWEGECLLLGTLGAAPPADEAPVRALRDWLAELIGPACPARGAEEP